MKRMIPLDEVLADFTEDWAARDLQRTEHVFSSAQTPIAWIDGTQYRLFSSSNYLGLAEDPRVLTAAAEAANRYGAGSGGSRLTTGTTVEHRQLESEIADFLGTEDALFCATGYQANVGVIAALAGALRDELLICSDELNHASIIDGTRMAKALGSQVRVFPHRNYRELERHLTQRSQRHALILSDGLFSMHAAQADVTQLHSIAARHQAWTMIDDAHAIGTVGESGRGSVELYHCYPDILVGTASKALGGEGGFIAGSQALIHFLRHRARPYVFSTAPSAITIATVRASLCILRTEPQRVKKLQANAVNLSSQLADAHLLPTSLNTPIVPVPVGPSGHAQALSARLKSEGIWAPAIRYPTVPEDKAIIRLALMATHSAEDINYCAEKLIQNFPYRDNRLP